MNSLSPIETLPFHVLNSIFAWLKKSPWKLPLGRCSKVLYDVFVDHIERRKGYILKSYRCMRYAAIWGDPILTQIPLNIQNFGRHAFVDLCISGNLELVRYVDAYLLLLDEASTRDEERKFYQRVGRWHSCAIKTLLRFNTFNRDRAIPQETIDKFIYYFFEDLSQTAKDRCIWPLSGVIEVHGKETCLFPMFKDYMLRHNHGNALREIRTSIIKEYFYVGDVEKAQTIEWPFYNFTPDMHERGVMGCLLKNCRTVHVACVKEALRSPNQNKEAAITAWNNYVGWSGGKDRRSVSDMHFFWAFAIAHNKTKMFYHLTQKYVTEHNIDVDYYGIWMSNPRANQTHIELWNLDPKTCLIRILSWKNMYWRTSYSRRNTFKRLIKYYPDVLHHLSVEQRKLYQYLGLFCPKCLKSVVKQGDKGNNVNEDHQCRYCKHTFPSIDDDIDGKSRDEIREIVLKHIRGDPASVSRSQS